MPDELPLHYKGFGARVQIGIASLFTEDRKAQGWALIDTGAQSSVIVESIAKKIGLQVGQSMSSILADGTTTEKRPTYIGYMDILGVPLSNRQIRFGSMSQVLPEEGIPDHERIIVLLGNDYLKSCLFTYDGLKGMFRLNVVSPD